MADTAVQQDKGLKSGALGLASSIVIGVSSTAPAYSLAASIGFVVVAASGAGIIGVKAPSIILLAFIPMFLIAMAYQQLNKAEPDCGTTFTWASRAFGPRVGWMGGWGIIAADVIVLSNLAQITGIYTFDFLHLYSLANNTFAVTAVGVVFIAAMTYICYRGIEISAKMQQWMLTIEVGMLIVFSIFALVKVFTNNATSVSLHPQWSWFWPGGLTLNGIVSAVLIAVFIYWGWDSAVSVNEETADPAKTPGRAAVISTLLLLVTFGVVTTATVAFAGVGTSQLGLANPDNASDVFNALGPTVFGGGAIGSILAGLLLLCVLTSAAASTQTSIMPTARTVLAMGAYKAIPERFARIHPKYLTPSTATIWMGVVSTIFYIGLTLVSSNVLADSIAALGMMIAFYYGLTGLACVWFYRHQIFHSTRNFFMMGVFPLLGGIMLFGAFIIACKEYIAPDYGATSFHGVGGVFLIGIGTLVLGVILMLVYNVIAPAFFKGSTLAKRDSRDLVLESADIEGQTLRLPDSGPQDMTIAPDLSNLPTGATAIDLETGEEFIRTEQSPDS